MTDDDEFYRKINDSLTEIFRNRCLSAELTDGCNQPSSTAPAGTQVYHPSYYGGEDNPYEAIKVIEAWNLGFNLGNTLKYISRAGKKDNAVEDLEKARWYLDREIQRRKEV